MCSKKFLFSKKILWQKIFLLCKNLTPRMLGSNFQKKWSPSCVHLLIWPLKVHTQGFFDSLVFSPQNPWCNDFCENFLKILIPCLESRVMKLMTRNLVEIEANLWHGISDPELMTRHSTNDTELFRKMTSLILMGKISPPGHCHTQSKHRERPLLSEEKIIWIDWILVKYVINCRKTDRTFCSRAIIGSSLTGRWSLSWPAHSADGRSSAKFRKIISDDRSSVEGGHESDHLPTKLLPMSDHLPGKRCLKSSVPWLYLELQKP